MDMLFGLMRQCKMRSLLKWTSATSLKPDDLPKSQLIA